MDGLARLNFVFGSNGTGKTTISRLIADPSRYATCQVTWANRRSLETMVYNRDFIELNFVQSPDIKGVFTLGERQVDTLKKIEETKAEIESIDATVAGLLNNLEGEDGQGGARATLLKAAEDLKGECWAAKTKHDDWFAEAFRGLRGSSEKFTNKVLSERGEQSGEAPELVALQQKAEAIYGEQPASEPILQSINGRHLVGFETDPLLARRIVGKADVDLAGLIERLGNSDWVRRGLSYLEEGADDLCPFCQQSLPSGFLEQMETYFDEAFTRDLAKLTSIRDDYALASQTLLTALDGLISSGSRFLNVEAVAGLVEILRSTAALNQTRLDSKVKEPSSSVSLEGLSDPLAQVQQHIDAANAQAKAHNELVANLQEERVALGESVWRYLVLVELADALKKYDQDCANAQKAIDALDEKIKKARGARAALVRELRVLEKSVTSTRPTVDAINELLVSLGFTSFSLAQAEREECYKLVRADGSDAKETLSEGERSFVTFLYFYHLMRGSDSEAGATNDRVVVFDDPVSSLDSDVLFVVSSLIRGIYEQIRDGEGSVKQLFVFTHNAYFHREVTFDFRRPQGKTRKDETFWIVRRTGMESTIERLEQNPVRTSYDLLWDEVRDPRLGSATIQNTLRRILENYFKVLGNVDPDEIIAQFAGRDQVICRSLFSWVNAGSHFALDDLFVAPQDSVEHYLRVFQEVFDKTGHGAHFRMMMKQEEEADPAVA